MTTVRRDFPSLAELDQPYRDVESRLTALLCGPQSKLTTAQHIERADALVAAFVELRALVVEMQLATYREPGVPMAVGMALRHALSAADADAAYWRGRAADHRADEKRAIMNAQRIETDGVVVEAGA